MKSKNLHLIFIATMIFFMFGCSKNPVDGTQPPVYDPRNVSKNSTVSANSFIAVDNSGTVHIVWRDEVNGQQDIFYSSKSVGGQWIAPVNISNDSIASSAPQIAVDPSGTLHVVWDELGLTPGSHAMYVNKPPSGSWSTPQDISSPTTSNGSLPQIGVDGAGQIYVAYDGGGGALYYMVRSAGGNWSTPSGVEILYSSGNPSLAVRPDGQMHVVYEDNLHAINYKYRSASGVWDSAVDVSRLPGHYCWNANIAVDNAGNVYAAWTDATVREVYFSIKPFGETAWNTPVNVSNSTANSWIPKMVVGPDSTLNYIWSEDVTSGNSDIYYKKRLTDGSWSSAENLSNTANDSRINCVVYKTGKIYFSWSEWPEGEIYYDEKTP